MSDVIVQAQGLEKSFRKNDIEIPVLRGIDFELRQGEMVAVTGASGAGKSTLLHILGTLEAPTRGKVLYGKDRLEAFKFTDRKLAEFRNRFLGFVFQFHYLLPEFSSLENVMMPGLIAGLDRAEVEKEAKGLLEFMGLGHRLTHRPTELSGGEQQRVAVARAVILKPKLLLADELTGNLDSENSERVMQHLIDLNRVTGVAILLVTHDSALAKKMQRRVHLKDGRWANLEDSAAR